MYISPLIYSSLKQATTLFDALPEGVESKKIVRPSKPSQPQRKYQPPKEKGVTIQIKTKEQENLKAEMVVQQEVMTECQESNLEFGPLL